MDEESQFWVAMWKIAATVLCVVVVSSAGCVANTHRLISRDIAAGADPIDVACAHDGDATDKCHVAALARPRP